MYLKMKTKEIKQYLQEERIYKVSVSGSHSSFANLIRYKPKVKNVLKGIENKKTFTLPYRCKYILLPPNCQKCQLQAFPRIKSK